jgi:TonB family protein
VAALTSGENSIRSKNLLDLDSRPDVEEPRERPAGWSLLQLGEDAPTAPPVEEVPDKDLFEIEHKPEGAFPIERAVLFSIAAHILLLVVLLHAPLSSSSGSHRGILGTLVESERERELNSKIPVIFRSAPGPSRQNPKPADLSDATRRAGGGDPNRPKSQTPFIAPRPGTQGLRPGDIAAQRRAVVPPQSTGTGADSSAAAAQGEKASGGPDAFKVPAPGKDSAGRQGPPLPDLERAIKEAARGVGTAAGEQGAGFPNPEGGFVDSGPISFDTTWYDWGPYAEEMVRRIKLHWEIPELARLGWKGKLTIRFFIRGDGRVEGARILSVSGVPPFDNAALQAILTSSPFRPLPKDLGSDREGVTVTFFYNIRPESDGQKGAR